MKVEILDSMFKNCSSKQACCTAGKSCKGVDLQMVKCTVSERFSQRNRFFHRQQMIDDVKAELKLFFHL